MKAFSSWSGFKHAVAGHYVALLLVAILIGATAAVFFSATETVFESAILILRVDGLVILLGIMYKVKKWWELASRTRISGEPTS